MNCCDDPKPRISTHSGRMFCANCRRFLDTTPEPLSDDLPEERDDDADEAEGDPS